jgi:hypothetical protein
MDGEIIMSEDLNWSLKDKERLHSGEIQHLNSSLSCYDKYDIETLRQKLIEDIKRLNNYGEDKDDEDNYNDWVENPKEDIIEIINRRFGVE